MSEVYPVVCVFGALNIEIHSPRPAPQFESTEFDCRCYMTDDGLYEVLAKDNPSVIVTFGKSEEFPILMVAPYNIRRRWIHFDNTENFDSIGATVLACYIGNATNPPCVYPLVTVFTPTYRTGNKILRPYNSLISQTYNNWEWVIIDDSDDNGETFEMLSKLAEKDCRIKLYKEHKHSGCIGHLKKNACLLGRGEYLVELDHDDELTIFALEKVVRAFSSHKECGFVYTDFAECFEDGSPVMYGKDISLKPPYSDWGFGYGSYRKEVHGGQEYYVANSPNINAKTIRHIVAAPNHIRAWRKDFYLSIGGHGDIIHVADDYELMLRTFLYTRMCRIPEMCYVQYRNIESGNTHRTRNKEIQRLVKYFSRCYDKRVHDRFLELGVDDFVWVEGEDTFSRLGSVKNPPEESHCTITFEG
jgi:glycosyltransferase involved in cell wall biosynthesis